MYYLLEFILRPICFVLNSISELKDKLYYWGVPSKVDPLWEWYELRSPEEKFPKSVNQDEDLTFVKVNNNKKKKVYELLKSNTEGLEKTKIQNKVKIKYDDLRSIMSQLRDDLVDQGIDKQIVAEKGVYKLLKLHD